MPLPNWKNINTRVGSAAAALGNTARGFGDTALAGFNTLYDQFGEQIEREDKLLTNDAINAKLRGETIPYNRRVDQVSLENTISNREAINADIAASKDTLLTSKQARKVTAQDLITKERTNSPEAIALATSRANADINADKASIGASNASTALSNATRKIAERDDAETQRINTEVRDMEVEYDRMYSVFIDEYLAANVDPQATPTQVQLQEARLYASQRTEGPEGRAWMKKYQAANNYLPDSYALSFHGRSDAALVDASRRRSESAFEREALRLEDRNLDENRREQGNLASAGVDNNRRQITLNAKQIKDQSMGSTDEAISKIAAYNRSNVTQLRDKDNTEERDLINAARFTFPNSSYLASAIEPYIAADGELDMENFSKVVDTAGYLARRDIINQRREAAGLPRIEDPEDTKETSLGEDFANIGGQGLTEMLVGSIVGVALTDSEITGVSKELNKQGSSAVKIVAKTATPIAAIKTLLQMAVAAARSKNDEDEAPKTGKINR